MSYKGYNMYFDVPKYSKKSIREHCWLHCKIKRFDFFNYLCIAFFFWIVYYSETINSCRSDYFNWNNIISIFLVCAFISSGLFRMLTILVIYFTYVVQVVMTLDHIGH